MALRHGLIAILATTSLALAGMASAAPNAGGAAPTGGKCGGIAGLKCASDKDYCMLKAGQCHVADAQGTCKAKPEVCTEVELPVCGCDGKTYGNACKASRSGVNVMSKGKCKSKG